MKPDYGLDAPRTVRAMFTRGALLAAAALVMRFTNPQRSVAFVSVLLSIGITFLVVGTVMLWSSRYGKLRARDHVLDGLSWRGDERVLDVGCGRGLFLIGAAKRAPKGKLVGIDIWSQVDLKNNSAAEVKQNAVAEGVGDRIEIKDGNATKIPFPDQSFDKVVSSLAIHNIKSSEARAIALKEMVRVLRPGGQLAIFDIFHTAAYAKVLTQLGCEEVRLSGLSFLWCVPTRSVSARRPAV